jgi:hypothetical protein
MATIQPIDVDEKHMMLDFFKKKVKTLLSSFKFTGKNKVVNDIVREIEYEEAITSFDNKTEVLLDKVARVKRFFKFFRI